MTLDRPDGGRVEIDGRDVSALGDRALSQFRNERIGFVFQFYNLVQNLTALENVELALQICKNPLDARQVLQEVGLGKRMKNFPAQLSGGEQQMLAMGRALMSKPRILLLDEPSMGLSPLFVGEIFKIIEEVSKAGTTAVSYTHLTLPTIA